MTGAAGRRVLVTGASGFIGRHAIAPLRRRGYEVHGVGRHAPNEAPDGLTWHPCDLLDARQTATLVERVRPSHLLHFAWYAIPGKYWTAEENLDWIGATFSLLRAFRAAGGIRAVAAGTCAEYEWTSGACEEASTPCRPATLYGASKLATQLGSAAWAGQTGFSLAWGRIFFLYGPYEPEGRLVSSVIRSLLARQPAECTAGEQQRDFLHVEDVGDAFAALLDSTLAGTVNVGSGAPVAVREVVQTLGALTGEAPLIRLGARQEPPGSPARLYADVRRLRRELGWRPAHGLEDGLRATIDWWRSRPA